MVQTAQTVQLEVASEAAVKSEGEIEIKAAESTKSVDEQVAGQSSDSEGEAQTAEIAQAEEVWQVVGGVDKGGIIVRTDRDPTSPQAEERLATGALVRALERDGQRLRYEKIAGAGPQTGWVCVQLQGKSLLLKWDPVAEEEARALRSEEALKQYVERFGKGEQGKGQFNRQSFGWRLDATAGPAVLPPRDETLAELQADMSPKAKEDSAPARRSGNLRGHDLMLTFGYAGSLDRNPPFARFDIRDEVCQRVGGFSHGEVVRDDLGAEFAVLGVKRAEGLLRLWFQPLGVDRRAAGAFAHASLSTLQSRLARVAGRSHRFQEATPLDFDAAEDSDGEEVLLCPHCRLPSGLSGYVDKEKREALLHGECMAQVMLQELKAKETERRSKEAATKAERRQQYDIGWAVERIPRNLAPASKLQCSPLPQGMVCLVFNQQTHSVRVAATFEPAAAVNLEYLSIALQVRRSEGREPLFSLDPLDPKDPEDPNVIINYKDEKQVKRFEPEWLCGTSVGEVMFQADYHLKELSMGEYEQPVVGMKSCHDFAEAEGMEKEWRAREWFVVRKAEVQVSDDDVLIPYVRMGVEAREQVLTKDGVEDAKITRQDHPLVKYAEAFTNNFDLIAERKSVVYHLRELAKASVMAKFLLESGVYLEETWFNLAGEPKPDTKLEIPQLWNERARAQIRLSNGTIVEAAAGPTMHGVYGGVQFGLDRFRTTAARPLGRPMQPTLLSGALGPLGRPSQPSLLTGAAPVAGRVAAAPYYRPSRPGMPSLVPGLRPHALVSAPRTLLAPGVEPMGVDLNLDRFDLTDATRVNGERKVGSWAALDACASLGSAFWQHLEEGAQALFKDDDRKLLKEIFNPAMSDRRQEGDLFCPPDTSFAYVTRLRNLVKEEESVRKARKDHFFSERFMASEPGPLFPYSWTNPFEIAQGRAEAKARGPLYARPDYKAEAAVFELVLKSVTPTFDKATEDGLRFRVYKFGSIEVRTTQACDEEEVIGAVFSSRSPRRMQRGGSSLLGEKFVKVTEYVERAESRSDDTADRRSFVVLETDKGGFVVTEKLLGGEAKWVENPADIEDRTALAKVVRSADCEILVRDMRRFHQQEAQSAASPGSSEAKRYAQSAYSWAEGNVRGFCSGFGKPSNSGHWRLHAPVTAAGAAKRAAQAANLRPDDLF